jgi:hypothetical protein
LVERSSDKTWVLKMEIKRSIQGIVCNHPKRDDKQKRKLKTKGYNHNMKKKLGHENRGRIIREVEGKGKEGMEGGKTDKLRDEYNQSTLCACMEML